MAQHTPYNVQYHLKEGQATLEKLKECCNWSVQFMNILIEQRIDSFEEIKNYSNEEMVKNYEKCKQMVNTNLKWVQEIIGLNFHLETAFYEAANCTAPSSKYFDKLTNINPNIYGSNDFTLSKASSLNKVNDTTIQLLNLDISLNKGSTESILNTEETVSVDLNKEPSVQIPTENTDLDVVSSEESCAPITDTDKIPGTTDSPCFSDGAAQPKTQSSVSAKINDQLLLSRRDRYVQNLPKSFMPDLSFKRVTVPSSSEYLSFSDSGSQATKKSKRKKRIRPATNYESDSTTSVAGSVVTPKVAGKSPKARIQDAELPNLNDLCGISYFYSPSEFYIHVSNENTNVIDSLGLQLNEWCRQKHIEYPTKKDAIEAIGQYCLVYIGEWDAWYRGEISNWMLSAPNNVMVKLMDYGEQHVISYKYLRILPDDYCYYPRLAVQCHLACLYPIGSTEDDLKSQWSDASLEGFAKLLDFGKEFAECFRVVFVEKQANSVAVDIIKTKELNEELTIGQLLINSGYAVQIVEDPTQIVKDSFMKNQIKTSQGLIGITSDMSDTQALDVYCTNLKVEEPANVVEAMTAYDATDEQRICPFTRPNGTCFKGRNCRMEHSQLRKDGYTTDKQLTFWRATGNLALPSVGDEIVILITYMLDVHNFYGHIQTGNNKGHQMKKLMEMMNKPDVVKGYKSLKMLPMIGELVIAKHADGKWSRAMVTEVEANMESQNNLEVFFVDFGEPMEVDLNDVTEMREIYLQVPFQAVNFLLRNVMPNNSDKEDAREFFESNYIYQELHAKVQYVGVSFLEVNVFDENKQDIGPQIIEAGFGTLKTENYIPKLQELLIE